MSDPNINSSNRLSSLGGRLYNEVMNNIFVWIAAAIGAACYFGFEHTLTFINNTIDSRIQRVFYTSLGDSQLNDDTKKIKDALSTEIKNILKNRAGQVVVGRFTFDGSSKDATVHMIAFPQSTTWLILRVDGLQANDKILMVDAETGYKEKISKNGPAEFNMNGFFKRSQAYSDRNKTDEPIEVRSDTKYFSNLHNINFTLRPAGSDQVGAAISGGKVDQRSRNINQVDISYIVIEYPPLSVLELGMIDASEGVSK